MSKAKRGLWGIVAILALIWVGGSLVGCGPRVHMHPDHGKSLKRHFLMQRIFPKAAEGTIAGLDSEEAAMIHASYRKEFGGKGGKPDAASRVLVLEEGKGGKKK